MTFCRVPLIIFWLSPNSKMLSMPQVEQSLFLFFQRLGLDLPPQTTTAPDGPAFGDDDDNDDDDEDGASDMFPGAVSLLLAAAAAIVIAH